MERQLYLCNDGSFTLKLDDFDESYHSTAGAYEESKYIYLLNGLAFFADSSPKEEISILEIGFGTGLNAILTYQFGKREKRAIFYETIEKYPLTELEAESLKYPQYIAKREAESQLAEEKVDLAPVFKQLHSCKWDSIEDLSDFRIYKRLEDIALFTPSTKYDVVYFDAFSYNIQPELWSLEIFKKIYESMNIGGVLITYSSKGVVKEALREAGFIVKRISGVGKKRHIVRAIKI